MLCRIYNTLHRKLLIDNRCFVESTTHYTENYWLINTNLTQVLCRIYNTLHWLINTNLTDVDTTTTHEPHTRLTQVLCRIYNTLHRKLLIDQHEPHSVLRSSLNIQHTPQKTTDWSIYNRKLLNLQHTTQKFTDWSSRTSRRCFVEPTTHYTENYWLINTNLTQVLCRIYNTLHRKRLIDQDEPHSGAM